MTLGAGFLVRELWAAATYPHVELDPGNVTFVFGLLGVVALHVGWLTRDLHERTEQYRHAQERLEGMVYLDALTRLPNRTRLLGTLDRLDGTGETYAVAFIDLDRFKQVNDSCGHESGDELLCGIARRLEEAVRPTDLVARLAGDEFVVVLREPSERGDVVEIARRLGDACRSEAPWGTEAIALGASVGVAIAGAGAPRGREVLRQADAAMYVAKRNADGEPVVVEATDHDGDSFELARPVDLEREE
jgi:diguanylate cyclase (GGDEF)-like protein